MQGRLTTAEDTLGHVDIVSNGSSSAVFSRLCFDSDSLSGTDGFTQLACCSGSSYE